jgi:hypothetical protein
VRKILILDRILPEIIEKREVIYSGSDTGVSLHESGEGREIEGGISRKVMGLKLIKIKKAPEEIRRRKAKSALKMGGKDNIFARLRLGMTFLTGDATPNLFRNPPGPIELVNLCMSHVGAHPGPARIRIQIDGGRLGSGAWLELPASFP